ncbi:kinesin-like protein KIF20A [Trichosurus vulpecula]|uniref:kinesin-like protein KIF20A n=1 Tax=Trichosurus vulpecula TaxID=9337 RepID=UPI00186B4095|nr:kinesin-like protein KIF20A [Trichosurus vulpecula]
MSRGILTPPAGLLSDEDVIVSPMFESTAADLGAGIQKDLLSEFSAISPPPREDKEQVVPEDGTEKVKVYLRIRPLLPSEVERHEEQGCVRIETPETLVLQAPKDSFAMKSTERGVGQATHRFTFSQIFGPEVGQASFFNLTVKEMIRDVLKGYNWLIYTYGVTNSGKTHTVQGSNKDGGILPRSLAVIFNSIQNQLYPASDLKPSFANEVIWLDSKQARQEEMKKAALLNGSSREEEVINSLKKSHNTESLQLGTSASFDSGIAGLSSTSQSSVSLNQMEDTCRWAEPDTAPFCVPADVRFSIWISFFEIYNEMIFDLLEPPSQQRKRQTLRLCEDQNGNPYVKDLNWINIQDADEAWKLLKLGRKNQSFASTHLNQNSSRSHSIFSIRILHLQGEGNMVSKISELSLCDLAGSERCKEQKMSERMKEAGNINTSLHTLGRCITAIRQNQQRLKQNLVPFRDSKLTRVFQGFFTGRGRSCMIVNVNPCASTYDETLHVAKFSAIASQLVHAPPVKLGLPSLQSFIKEHSLRASPTLETGAKQEAGPDENSGDEVDISMYDKEEILQVVEAMKELLLQERQEKLKLEVQLRDEICTEMIEQMQQREQWCSEHLDTQKELLEEMYEDKLKILKESLQSYYQEELQERDEKIKELEEALQEAKKQSAPLQIGLDPEQSLRRSERVASSISNKQLQETKAKLEQCKAELASTTEELQKYQRMLDPPPSAKPFTVDVDKKLEEGQKNVRLLKTELQKLGESLQSAERACCHSTGAGKLRQALTVCDDILIKQDQTLTELQNNMMLVKLDLRKKAACIAEQYHTVMKLQGPSSSVSLKKRQGPNQENQQPTQQPPGKKPFLRNLLPRTPTCQGPAENSPYSRILRSRRSPLLKSGPFGKKY